MKRSKIYLISCCLATLFLCSVTLCAQNIEKIATPSRVFSAGAALSNITPKIGVSMNGNFQDQNAKHIHDELHARCIVLDDGEMRLAIVVADLCMVPREILDETKRRAHAITNIPVENMLISATHTHSAGTACAVFQSEADTGYVTFLSDRIADAVIRANNNLAPARIGWGVGQEPSQVFNRRWRMKPGTAITNPFGTTDQAVMNPGIGNPNLLEPAGPTDPEVPLISIQSLDGRPIALLANYSLHYVGGSLPGEVSADYYGMFADRMNAMLGADRQDPPFVAMMSNGTSGDINNINFRTAHPPLPPYGRMQLVANLLASEAYKVLQNIQYH
ncbi:MAG TPA: neutral/alkaline non-lysosomal ceramidase N-terminal domain-containing protein, partial [Chryseosolibacter sp.]